MKLLVRLAGLAAPYWRLMSLGGLVALAVVLANMALLGVAGWFIAAMAAAGAAGTTMNYFLPAAAIRAFAIVRTGGRYVERLVTHEATLRFLSGLRVWFYERVEPLAPAALESYRGGDLLSRIVADIDALDNFYLRVLVPAGVALFSAAATFGFLMRYDASLAAVALVFLALVGVAIPALAARLGRAPGARLADTGSALRVAVVDSVQGMGELMVYGAAGAQRERVATLSARLVDDQDTMSRITGFTGAAAGLCLNLAVWLVTIIAIALVRRGGVPAVDLPMFALVVMASFEGVNGLPLAYQYLGHTLASARRIFAIADREPPVADPATPRPLPAQPGIVLQEVGLRYGPEGPWALQGVNLRIEPGQRVAIVGPSGSGKSSLIGLLLRFRDCQRGTVGLTGPDGGGQASAHELREYRTEDLRRTMAVVPQRTHLFNTTVRENLRLAAPDADQDRLEAAAARAGIHDTLAALPQGYDTYVGEAGVKLSGGQARRVAIARALLKNAPILILDEPTEGLDPATERRLLQRLLDRRDGQTLIVITHRLVGLEVMDRIAVMENGRIVETGTHQALMEGDTRYRRMRAMLAETPAPQAGGSHQPAPGPTSPPGP